jgi:thioredoxin reductase (NADPH)
LLQQHAERFGAQVVFDTATEVDFSARPYRVTTYAGVYTADSVIIATGATPRHLEVPGEEQFTGRGVSYCGTCDGFFFKDKKVLVVGGGDSALEEGAFLTRFATDVNIVHRRDELRASPILINRANNNAKIDFTWDTVVRSIEGKESVEKVTLENTKTGEKTEYETDGVFIFIGHTPNTQMFEGQLALDEHGYLITENWVETELPGVFAAGEVADSVYRQVVTSAGMGSAAAIAATRYVESLEDQYKEQARAVTE